MFRIVRMFAVVASASLLAMGSMMFSSQADARGGHFGGGHFGGGHFGGGHFGGRHFGGFGGRHFGGRHFGGFGGRHFGGRHFGGFRGRHFGGRHFGGRHFGGRHFGGRHFGHRGFARGNHFRGSHFARGHRGVGNHGFANRHFRGNRHFASHGRALAATGRMTHAFGRHGYGHHFARNGFWHNRYAYGRYGRWHRGWGYGWYGPVFWPYAYGDIFAFALWPYDYYDPFWDYGSDWILSSLFWPGGEPGYFNYGGGYDYGDIYGLNRRHRSSTSVATASIPEPQQQDACGSLAPGVAQLPVARIQKAIAPTTEDQRAALKDFDAALAKGADIMKQACPAEAPLTPPAKLEAVTQRLTAMKTAIGEVRPSLDKLYSALSDDQQRRFDKVLLASQPKRRSTNKAAGVDVAKLCEDRGPAFTDLPAEQIERAINLNDDQRAKLDALKTASTKAADISKRGCISKMPTTVGGRLDAVEKRVDALLQATNELQPAVDGFYASLSDEQKARFNSIGVSTANSSPGSPSSTGSSSGETGTQSPASK